MLVLTQHRDSGPLDRCNFEVATEMLGEECEIVRVANCLVGWIEELHTTNEKLGNEILEKLEAYPILDEDAFSEMEWEEANRVWCECYNDSERVVYIREHRHQFDFEDFMDLYRCAKGEYFKGYASELIQ